MRIFHNMVIPQTDSELYFETVCAFFKKEVHDGTALWTKYYKEEWKYLAENELLNIKYLPSNEYFFIPLSNSQVPNIRYPYHNFKTLEDWIKPQTIDAAYTERAFEIANQMVQLIKLLHQQKIIHGAINTSHFLVSENDKVLLSEWIFLTNAVQPNLKQNKLDDSYDRRNYIATEQKRRINIKLGFRIDLYALGACLYKLFTGTTAFDEDDQIEIIYKHIPFDFRPAHFLNPNMGKETATIIGDLLNKESLSRNITAEVTQSALEKAYQSFKNKHLLPEYELISSKRIANFNLIQHFTTLIENKIHYFKSKYLQAIESNECFLFFIQGVTGAGKQFVVSHCCEIISNRKTLVLDTFFYKDKPIPYEPFKIILDLVIKYYLSQAEEELHNFRSICRVKLGSSINILIDICPELNQVIPYAKQDQEEGLIELQNQFIFAFATLLKVIISTGKKLILCLKDIHHAPISVLKIIDGMLYEFPSLQINLIFTYEADILKPNQLSYVLKWQNHQQPGFTKGKIELVPLTNFESTKLLTTTGLIEADLEPLINLLLPKTNGLIFLIDRACEILVVNDALYFDSVRSKWKLNYEKAIVCNINFTNPSVYFEGLISKLSNEELILLSYAAAFGKSFSFDIIKTAIKNERLAINLLDQLMHKGVLKESIRIGFYEFSEYDLSIFILQNIKGKTLAEINYAIISAYNCLPNLEISDEDFINLLDKVLSLPTNQAKSFISILWRGIMKTNKLALFDINYQCYTHLIKMLEDDDWISNKEALIDLYTEYIKSASLVLKFDVCEQTYNFLRSLPLTKLQLGNLGYSYANALFLKRDFKKTIRVLVEILFVLEVPLNTNPSVPQIMFTRLAIKKEMRGKSMAYLEGYPMVIDDISFIKIKLLQHTMGTAYLCAPKMIPELILKQLTLSSKNGASNLFGVGIIGYAYILSTYHNNPKEARKLFTIASSINERIGDPIAKATSEFLYSTFIGINHLSWRECSDRLYNNYIFSRQLGQMNIAFFSLTSHFINQFYSEFNIERMAESLEAVLPTIQANKQENIFTFLHLLLSFSKGLINDTIPNIKLAHPVQNIDEIKKTVLDKQEFTTLSHIYILEEMVDFFNCNYTVFKTRVKKIEEMKSQLKLFNSFIIHQFFIALKLLKKEDSFKVWELLFIKKTIQLFGKKCNHQKENTYAMYQLLKGLYLLRWGRPINAITHLQSAYECAILNDQYMTAAISSEEIASIYHKQNRVALENIYARNAYTQYKFWGAKALMRKIEIKYPFLQSENGLFVSSERDLGLKDNFQDFSKPSKFLSKELGLQPLLRNIINTLIENTVAENISFLIVDNYNRFLVLASKRSDGVVITKQIPASETILPLTIIQYVFRTKKGLLLNNALKDTVFKNDLYISENQARSILCVPVLKDEKTRALILLENNRISQAFTHETSEKIQAIASQIAVAFDNTALYYAIKEKNIIINKEAQNEKSEELQLNVVTHEIVSKFLKKEIIKNKMYHSVTVLFIDFIDFENVTKKYSTQEIIKEFDFCLEKIDQIINQFDLKRIKSVNKSYQALCGLPKPVERHAERVLEAALAIQKFIQENKKIKKAASKIYFEIRIGISSGSVVARVKDTKEYSLDIWGDAVDMASMLMKYCEVNRIHISSTTHELVKEWFECESHEIVINSTEESIKMYYVNDQQLFYKVKHCVFQRMQDLDPRLHYHTIWHTTDVLIQVERIAMAEGIINERQLLLVKIVVFFGMLALAALNRWRLTPSLDVGTTAHGDLRRATARVKASVAIETTLALAVVLTVSWLGTLDPPNTG